MIDRTLRWPEAIPLSSITAESCARAFISTWVSRFGVPALLTSDRGAQFTSSIWLEVCSVLGISHIQTTSFHPQSNGMIERFQRSLKCALRARMAGSDWVSHLPLVMLGLRTAPKDDSGSLLLKLSLELTFLFQASSSNIPSFLRRFFSGRLNVPSLGTPDLLVIMWSFLNLSLYRETFSLLSLFLSKMMLQNLPYLHSTEVHTR